MNAKLFGELLAGVREGATILRGEEAFEEICRRLNGCSDDSRI